MSGIIFLSSSDVMIGSGCDHSIRITASDEHVNKANVFTPFACRVLLIYRGIQSNVQVLVGVARIFSTGEFGIFCFVTYFQGLNSMGF